LLESRKLSGEEYDRLSKLLDDAREKDDK